jgi:hypothetical protein
MRLITYGGRTQNLAAWAKEIGIGPRSLCKRLATGWSLEQTLSAGKRQLFKGEPALAPLGKLASPLDWRPTGGGPAIQWKRFCSQVLYRINVFSHLRPDKEHYRMGR